MHLDQTKRHLTVYVSNLQMHKEKKNFENQHLLFITLLIPCIC